MLPHKHFLWSLIPGAILFYFYRWNVLIFIAVNVLIDSDHYPVYAWKFKNLSIKKAYNYFRNLTETKDIAIFHTIEFIILIFILSFFYKTLFLVFLGLIFHLALDVHAVYFNNIKRPFSLISSLIKRI